MASAFSSASSSSSFLSTKHLPATAPNPHAPLLELYLLEPLASSSGGSGGSRQCVWRAIHRPSGELCAIKVLKSTAALGEVALLTHLPPHPHLISLNCVWAVGEETWMSLRLMDASLSELLVERGQPFSESLLGEVLVMVLMGLAHLHSHGVSHRDIKPSNVCLTAEGGLCLSDLGAATRFQGGTDASPLTLTGTPLYLAPEIISRTETTCNPLGDVWSLGILSLECYDTLPYASESLISALFKVCTAPPPQPPLASPASPALLSFLDKMLQRDPLLRAPPAHLLAHPFLEKARAMVEACGGCSPELAAAMDAALPGIIAARREALASAALPHPGAAVASSSSSSSSAPEAALVQALPLSTSASTSTSSRRLLASPPLTCVSTTTTTTTTTTVSSASTPAAAPTSWGDFKPLTWKSQQSPAAAAAAAVVADSHAAPLPAATPTPTPLAQLEAQYAEKVEALRLEYELAKAAHLHGGGGDT
jgi:serine/threonine protein kinase